jgi:uncharacterized protein (TIGR03118 family)
MSNSRLWTFSLALVLSTSGAHAGGYNEAVSGDLSNNGLLPTAVALGAGSNLVLGSTGNPGTGVDLDYFTVTVAAGTQLTALKVMAGTAPLGLAFLGLQAGSQVTVSPSSGSPAGLLGWSHYAASDIGADILPRIGTGFGASGFSGPLGPGSYAFWIQDFNGGVSSYALDLTVAAVPEPAAAPGLLCGLAALAGLARRRRRSRRPFMFPSLGVGRAARLAQGGQSTPGIALAKHPSRAQTNMAGSTLATVAVGLALVAAAVSAQAASFQVVNLVTDDQSAHPAQITDAGLINAWGVSFSPTSPFWVSSNGAGTSTLYTVNPTTQVTAKSAITVTIPPGGGPVTGQVFNSNTASGAFNADNFLFVSEDGTVSGWRNALGSTAQVLAPGSAANVYKGSAFATLSGNSYLYAANFRAGTIDVFKGSVGAPNLSGSFIDPNLPAGFAPFNIQNLGGTLYVAYALQDVTGHDEVDGLGFGFVDSYTLQGQLIGRVASQGTLNAPWGLAIAPSSFGAMAGALLVGNFGDGRIGAYDATTHAFLGLITDGSGAALAIDGLWAITPGNGGSGGSTSLLYFSAGPDNETHGLFGVLTPVPEPAVAWLWACGLGLGAVRLRRRHKPLA